MGWLSPPFYLLLNGKNEAWTDELNPPHNLGMKRRSSYPHECSKNEIHWLFEIINSKYLFVVQDIS